MSRRYVFPSKPISSHPCALRSRAAATVSPSPVTVSTRPPATRTVPSGSREVPAWNTSVPGSRSRGTSTAAPSRGLSGYPGAASTVATAARLGDSIVSRGLQLPMAISRSCVVTPGSTGSNAWVSGSPNRQLNSST